MLRKLLVSTIMLSLLFAGFAFPAPHAEAATFTATGDLTFQTGDMSNPYDDYGIIAEAGEVIQVTLLCLETVFDPYIQVWNESATVLIASNDDSYPGGPEDPCNFSSLLTFTVPQTGTYLVSATSFNAVFNQPNNNGGARRKAGIIQMEPAEVKKWGEMEWRRTRISEMRRRVEAEDGHPHPH